jgi:CheY-like chemotaxis protein
MSENQKAVCFHCSVQFDVESSHWCDCIQRSRSLVCPACGLCSCAAPPEWKVSQGSYMLRRLPDTRRAAPAEPAEPVDSRPLVLVVDDQAIVQTLVREGLSTEFRVMTASDGVEGFALVKAHHPDVVITDALMPKLDGRELCRNIKIFPPTSKTKVVIMSALYTTRRHENEARDEFGADAFLRKPVTLSQLRQTVHSMLDASSPARIAL